MVPERSVQRGVIDYWESKFLSQFWLLHGDATELVECRYDQRDTEE